MSSEIQHTASDQALLARARTLDPDALTEIHDRYYAAVLSYIAFRLRDRSSAEDLTHEVFVRFLSALRDGPVPHTTVRGWLFGVAAHLVQDFYRNHYRTSLVELDESLISADAGPAEVVEALMVREDLQQALTTLTEEQQHVIGLRFGQGMTIHEVSRMLGKTAGAVKQLQARAVLALAKRMTSGKDV